MTLKALEIGCGMDRQRTQTGYAPGGYLRILTSISIVFVIIMVLRKGNFSTYGLIVCAL
jgi:hypothetical protein